MTIAFIAVNYYLLSDLRAININSFCLLLILLGTGCWQQKEPGLAGILLGTAWR